MAEPVKVPTTPQAPTEPNAAVAVELKPCPWCGQPPTVCEDDSYGGCGVSCSSCDVMPDQASKKVGDLAQAIIGWNTRIASENRVREGAGEDKTVPADVMIGEFIARWEEAADGVMMDADTAEALAREFKRMRGLIYVPGAWRCAKCEFRLIQSNLNALDGTVTARDEPGDRCPNDGSPLWRVTYRDDVADAYGRWEEQVNRATAAEKALASLPHPTEPGTVPMPTNEDEAAAMALLGHAWLKEHAPHRLRDHPTETRRDDAGGEVRGGSTSRFG